ncbi:hypothetical protein [Acinetobacter sp. ANC 5502]
MSKDYDLGLFVGAGVGVFVVFFSTALAGAALAGAFLSTLCTSTHLPPLCFGPVPPCKVVPLGQAIALALKTAKVKATAEVRIFFIMNLYD